MNLISPRMALLHLPTLIAETPCVFMTADNQMLPLSETELWKYLDEINAWSAGGCRGTLSDNARIVLDAPDTSARAKDVFKLWAMAARGAVC